MVAADVSSRRFGYSFAFPPILQYYEGDRYEYLRTELGSFMNEAVQNRVPQLSPENFINREISTIDFQERVLALAETNRRHCWSG